jgi:hypothetical protein
MLTLFEFTILGLYLATLLAFLVAIQVMNPGKAIREALHPETMEGVESDEQFAELELEEPDSDEEVPFDPTKEAFTMTENPMLRHRKVEMSEMEMVD